MEVTTASLSTAEHLSAQPEFGPQMPLSEKLLAIAIRAQNFTGASGVAVAIKEGQEVVCRASWGTSAPDVGVRLQDQNSFTYQCLRAGKAMRCDDAYADTRVDNAACQSLGIRSIAAAPVHSGDEVLGVIAAFSEDANAFHETHMVILTTLGEVVAKFLKDEPVPATTPKADDLLAIEDDLLSIPPATKHSSETTQPADAPSQPMPPKMKTEPAKPAVSPAIGAVAKTFVPKTAPPVTKPGLELEREPEIPPDAMISGTDIPRDPSLVNSDAPTPPVPVNVKPPSKLAASLGDKRPAWLGMIDKSLGGKAAEVEPLAADSKPAVALPDKPAPAGIKSLPKAAPTEAAATADSISLTFTDPAEPVVIDKRKYMIWGGAAALLVLVLSLWTWHSHRASHKLPPAPPTAPVEQPVADNDASFQTPPPAEQNQAPAKVVETKTNQKPTAANKKEKEKDEERKDKTADDTVKIVNAPIKKPAPLPQSAPEAEAAPPTVTVSSASLPADLLAVRTAVPAGPSSAPTSHYVPSEAIQKVSPIYPEVAKRTHTQGRVVLSARIDVNGKVRDVKVVSGPAAFQQSAMDAVRRWKYRPAFLNGQPVESNAEVTLNFSAR